MLSDEHCYTKTKQSLTIDPANADALKDGHKQQTHATGCIRVKELEHVHATLIEHSQRNTGQTDMNKIRILTHAQCILWI